MLHSNCARALRRLDIKIANGDCPSQSQDPDIADFHATILGVSIDLLRDPLVREAVTHTAATRLKDLTPTEAATLIQAADAVAEASEGPLATELPTDARAAADLTIPDPDRKEALYTTASRLFRVKAFAKDALAGAVMVTDALIYSAAIFESLRTLHPVIRKRDGVALCGEA